MPQAVQAIATFAVWLFTGTGFWVNVVRAVLLTVISSKLFAPKLPGAAGLSGLQATVRGTLEFRKVIYGEAIVSGPIVYSNLSGSNGEDLWFVVPMCLGLSDDLVAVYLDADKIPKADIAWTAGTGGADGTGTGIVSTAKFQGTGSPFATALRVYYYLGDDDMVAPGALDSAFTDITSNFRLRGNSYVIFRLTYNQNTESVWKAGVPNGLKAVYKGRQVYDSRKDSTNGGSGAHRFLTESTWEWSDNPALCLANYLMKFMDVDPATRIDWPAFVVAADACEVLVDVPPAASPANTEKRFTCNGALSLGVTHKDNLDELLSSMDGRLSYIGGKWVMRASVFEAASEAIVEDDLAGEVVVRGSAPRSDRFNTVRGFFVDPARDYQPSEFPHVSRAAYVTRDNGDVLEYDLKLPFTNSQTMAQRIAFRILEQGNNQVVAELTLNASGALMAPSDMVDITISELSWTAKDFRLVTWAKQQTGIITATLREDFAASYNDPLVADYTGDTTGPVTEPADVVPPTSGLAAASVDFGIQLTWTNPAADVFDIIEVYESDTDQFSASSKVAETRSDTITIPYATAVAKFFWTRARKNLTLSLRDPDSDTSTITATPNILTDGTDGTDGLDAITGFIEPENGLAWTRATTGGAWAPTQLTSDLDCTFILGNTVVARIARRITLTEADGTLVATTTAHKGGNLNTGRVTVTVTGSASTAITVQFDYSFGGDTGSDTASASSAQGGDDGVLHYLTNEAHVIPANFDGGGYDTAFTGAGGTHKVFEGTSDETANSTHSVIGGATKNGLTISVVSGTGVYSLSGSAWTTDIEVFTLRAVFNGVNYDKEYTIAKAKQGTDGGCALDTLTLVNLSEIQSGGTRTVGVRADSDGDIYERASNASSFISKETWIGACANTEYQVRLNKDSGTTPTGAAIDAWLALSTDRQWELSTTGVLKVFAGTLQIRRTSDNKILATVDVDMVVDAGV